MPKAKSPAREPDEPAAEPDAGREESPAEPGPQDGEPEEPDSGPQATGQPRFARNEPEEGDLHSRGDIPNEISLLPLRDSVIYPMLIAPLSVARASGIQLIDESVASNNRVIGAIAQRRPHIETPGFDDVFEHGCAVIVRTLVKMPDAVRLIVQGMARFRIVERLQETPYLRARIEVVEEIEPPADRQEEVEALRRSIAAMFEQAIRLSPNLPDELTSLTTAVQEPNVMADLVAAHMTLPVEDKQRLLETQELLPRLRMLLEMLGREVRVLELSSKVYSEVTAELSKTQRNYYLREQLKAIQRELGEDGDHTDELKELRTRLDASGMTPEALRECNREYERLRRINPGSPEYTVARTYLDAMVALPWQKATEDNLRLPIVKAVLDHDHYGLDKIKERIIEFLAVRKVKTDGPVRQPILCFAGPPGVGKTSLGRSIAHAMGRKFVRISLGGMRDEAEIRGHRRTYVGALPGQIMQGLRRAGSNNPVFVLDEIDKLGTDFRGDPSSALLEVLDPEQNATFRDHYLDVPFDLSRVFFITTANRLDTIPPALRDRMEVIELGGYTEEEKLEIAKRHLVPKQIGEHGLKRSQLAIDDGALRDLIRHYTREAGVRNLEREIGSVVRKATLRFAEGRKTKLKVTSRFLHAALGAPRFLHDAVTERELTPGMAVGLAWTPVGGDVLFIETARMAGQRGLTVTGQLGDVMKESVTAALSFVRAHASELGIAPDFFDTAELHVHVPAGAVPKDGPSAGVTMLVAIVSLLTGRRPRQRVAMTGEVTLSGQVLPVGGVKEKVLAAHRAGVQEVVLPLDNRKDYLEDVPEPIRKRMCVHFVRRAREALDLALEPA
jgi:ATP-dependent Lon protease